MKLSKEDRTSLTWLRMNYEDEFRITLEDDGTWQALPLSGEPDVLTSDDPYGLRDDMRAYLGLRAGGVGSGPPKAT